MSLNNLRSRHDKPTDAEECLTSLEAPTIALSWRVSKDRTSATNDGKVKQDEANDFDFDRSQIKDKTFTELKKKLKLDPSYKEKLIPDGLLLPLPAPIQPYVIRLPERRKVVDNYLHKEDTVPIACLYVTHDVGMALLRGANLYCPGVVAFRVISESNESKNLLNSRVEIRLLPSYIHVTRGSEACIEWDYPPIDSYWEEYDRENHNKVAEGRFLLKSRRDLFHQKTGTAVEIEKLFYYGGMNSSYNNGLKKTKSPLPSANGLLEGKLWQQHTPSTMSAIGLLMEKGGKIVLDSDGCSNTPIRILDMCSAPGGKTMALADVADELIQMKNSNSSSGLKKPKVEIIALDRSFTKLRKILRGCEEMGFSSSNNENSNVLVNVFKADSTDIVAREDGNDKLTKKKTKSIKNDDGSVSTYHKQLMFTPLHWEAFYRVTLGGENLNNPDSTSTYRSEKKILKAVLKITGRDSCNREIVEGMMRVVNNTAQNSLSLEQEQIRETARNKVESDLGWKSNGTNSNSRTNSIDNSPNSSISTDTSTPVKEDHNTMSSILDRLTAGFASMSLTSPVKTTTSKTTTSTNTSTLSSTSIQLKPPFQPSTFDYILADVPCSGLGQKPLLRFETTFDDIVKTAAYQKQFMKQAFQLLKPGGYMMYSTCSLTYQENEENVAWFLNEYEDQGLELIDLREEFKDLSTNKPHGKPYDHKKLMGLELSIKDINKLKDPDNDGPRTSLSEFVTDHEDAIKKIPAGWNRKYVMRFDPRFWDLGFFMAKFRKRSGGS